MRSCLLALLAVGFWLGPAAAQDATKGDYEKIQGTWKVVSLEDGGRKAPDDVFKNDTWIITKDKITYQAGANTTEWSYTLDPAQNPKWIDLLEGSRTTLGIYQLDGDDLKLCFPEGRRDGRSTAFESKPGSVNDILIVLKREKP